MRANTFDRHDADERELPHAKWQERPLACVVVEPGEELAKEELLDFLSSRVAKWWLPDEVAFIDAAPKTSVASLTAGVVAALRGLVVLLNSQKVSRQGR